jgi:hypothetical protein
MGVATSAEGVKPQKIYVMTLTNDLVELPQQQMCSA